MTHSIHSRWGGWLRLCLFSLSCLALPSLPVADAEEAPVVEDETEFVLQPAPVAPAPTPPATPRPEATRTARRSSRSDYVRAEKLPNMFGDSLGLTVQLGFAIDNSGLPTTNRPPVIDVPLGVGRNFKIGENNKPIPMDRVAFTYNGFQNALHSSFVPPGQPAPITRDGNVERYTLAGEKTYWDGLGSIEIRIPLVAAQVAPGGPFANLESGNFGDLSLFLKHLFYEDDTTAMAFGVGIGLPTSPDVRGSFGTPPTSTFVLHTDAVHLMPYVGLLSAPNEDWFVQAFLQFDFAASGNRLDSSSPFLPAGVLTEQHLLAFDLSLGRWLINDLSGPYLEGIAGILELHYTTTLQDADIVTSPVPNAIGGGMMGNLANRVDLLNLTGGLHFQLTPLANLRVGCVVPLRQPVSDRQFDAEVQVSFNRFF